MKSYRLVRKKNHRRRKGKPAPHSVRRISVGNFDLEFSATKHVYRGVCELIAERAKRSGEFEVFLEDEE